MKCSVEGCDWEKFTHNSHIVSQCSCTLCSDSRQLMDAHLSGHNAEREILQKRADIMLRGRVERKASVKQLHLYKRIFDKEFERERSS